MLLIARSSERRKSCSNYNLKRIQQPFGFAPAAAFSINVPALLSVIPDISNRSTIMYLMASFPRGNKRSGRCFGILVRLVHAGLRIAERPTRSRDPAQFQKPDLALTARG